MKKCIFAAAILFIPMAASAQQALSGDEVRQLVSGKTVDFGSTGNATYKVDGKYEFYNKNNGATSRGKWSVQGNRLCVDFENGSNRCDQLLRDGSKVVLKNPQGTSYPVTLQ